MSLDFCRWRGWRMAPLRRARAQSFGGRFAPSGGRDRPSTPLTGATRRRIAERMVEPGAPTFSAYRNQEGWKCLADSRPHRFGEGRPLRRYEAERPGLFVLALDVPARTVLH